MEILALLPIIWIIAYILDGKGSSSVSKRKLDESRRKNIEYYYGKSVEAARRGELIGIKGKKRWEESPEFKELGITPVEL